jgi:hypothetical protein
MKFRANKPTSPPACCPFPLRGLSRTGFAADSAAQAELPGEAAFATLDAHQGVPAEMAYIRSSIAQANGIDRGGTTNSYLTRGSVNNEFAIFRSPEST